ncbi:MAG TPA: SDR family oxidoreductase [Kofleriaceae bacterium]|nr:SDR family oxidoreductase [Kofleriaceae bacterium]
MANDLAGKTYIITGANTGIGLVAARELARRGARVILANRSAEKTAPVIAQIKRETGNDAVEFVKLDLSDLDSVRACAKDILERTTAIDGLINNAGFASGLRGAKGLTKDGFELTFGTNHLGHYLLTRLLLDRITQTRGARIVNVASSSHYRARGIDWDAVRRPTKSVTGLPEYAVSKLANVLFTIELARRLEGTGVTAYALHPGTVATDVWRGQPAPLQWVLKKALRMITPEQGAYSMLRCATAPELAGESGRYYNEHGEERRPNRIARDGRLARELWVKSAEWTGLPA